MKLKYDYWDRTRPCDIYLARSGKRMLGALNGIERADFTPKMCEPSTLELEISSMENGETTNFYDEIDSFMELYIPEFGWFYIEEPPRVQRDANKETKSFTAMSYEYTLKNDDLVGFKINCGTANSLEMYDENLDVDGIPKEQIVLYNPDNPSLSLIHLVLSNANRVWKTGHIDTPLKSLRRSFEEDSTDILSFFQKMSKAFRCIFQFDSVNMQVNAFDISTYGKNTNICLTYDTILNNCSIQSDSDEIYTVFSVEGDDDLMVNPVNLGSSDIININYFLHRQFPQSVIDKYDAYLAARSTLSTQYLIPYKKYADALEHQTEIKNRVPEDAVTNNWAAYDLPQLYTEMEIYKKLVAKIEERNKKPDGTLDMSNSPDLGMYLSFKNVVIPDIQAEITRKESGSVTEAPKTDYETMWELYGVNELEAKISSYEQLIAGYEKNGYDKPWPGGSGTGTEALWKSRQESYKKYKNYLKQAQAALKERKSQFDSWQSVMDTCEREMDTLSKKGRPDHPDYGFTKEELTSIKALYRHTDYKDNYITLSDFDGINGKLEKQKELLQSAIDQLEIESQPQLQFSISTDNPFYMEEFSHLREEMDIGNFIYVETAPSYYEKARISEMSFSILEWDKDLEIKFSTVTTSYGKKSDFLNLVDKISSSSKNSIKAAASTATDSAIQKFLRTVFDRYTGENSLNNQINGINSDTLKQFANIETNYLKTNELAAEIAKVGKLEADSAFIKYLTAQFITADSAVFKDLSAEIAKFKDMVAGNILVEDGYVFNFTAKNAHLDEAFIREFVASKITALVLTSAKITSNDLLIQTNEGDAGMKLVGNTMQFYNNEGQIGIQLGYDTEGNPNLIICDKSGNVMLDGAGLHEAIVPDKFIKSNMVGKSAIKQENLDLTNIQEWRDINGTPVFDISKFKYNDEEFSQSYESYTKKVEHLSTMVDSIELIGSQVFTQSKDGTITPDSITIKAIAKNNASVSKWLIDGTIITSGIAADNLSINIPSSMLKNKKSILLRAETSSGSIYDEFSLYKVMDGEDAVSVFLSNENCSFASTYSGIVEGVTAVTSVTAYRGAQIVPCTVGNIQGIPTGMSAIVKNNSTTTTYVEITVTPKLTEDSGVLHIPVDTNGINITKDFVWNKTKHAAQPVNIVCSNESDNLPADEDGRITMLTTLETTFTAYKGTNIVPCTVTTPTSLPSGMSITQTTYENIVTVKITVEPKATLDDAKVLYGHIDFEVDAGGSHFIKQFSWVKSRTGANAKLVSIVASSLIFTSKDGGLSFLPDTITLSPTLQGVSFSKWQYSTDGGSIWSDITNNISGLSISKDVLTLSKECSLFTENITAIGFKSLTNVSGVTDTITISKLYDLKAYGGNIIVDGGISIATTLPDINTYALSEDLEENQKYTLVIKGSVNPGNKLGVYFKEIFNPYISTVDGNIITDTDGNGLTFVNWQNSDPIWTGIESANSEIATATITTPPYITDKRFIGFVNYPDSTATNAVIEWVCLYKGNVNTPDGFIPNFSTMETSIINVERKTDNNTKSISDKVWQDDTYTVTDKNGNPVTMTMKTMLVEHHQDINGFTDTVNKYDERITTAEQTADKFNWLVENKPDATSSTFTITDRFISLTSSALNIDSLTTFKNNAENGTSTIINGGAIKADTINGNRIIVNTLEGNRIKVNTINGDKIIAGSIDGDKIKADSIDGNKIKADSIDGGRIISNTLDASKIKANSITSNQLTTSNINGTHGWINLAKGIFNYNDKLKWDGANLTVNGVVNATSGSFSGSIYATNGTIGGWKITGTDLYDTTNTSQGAGIGKNGTTFAFWAGSTYANRNTAPFRVGHEGNLIASNANITGDIDAKSINIANKLSMYSNNTGYNSSILELTTWAGDGLDILEIGNAIGNGFIRISKKLNIYNDLEVFGSGGITTDRLATQYIISPLIQSQYSIEIKPLTSTNGSIIINSEGYLYPSVYNASANHGFSLGTPSNRFFSVYLLNSPKINSLYSLKTNIEKLVSAKEEIMKTEVYSYNMKANLVAGITKKNYGFIIGGGYSISEKFIDETGESINGYNIDAFLCKGIQELYNDTDSLKGLLIGALARIQELETKLQTINK